MRAWAAIAAALALGLAASGASCAKREAPPSAAAPVATTSSEGKAEAAPIEVMLEEQEAEKAAAPEAKSRAAAVAAVQDRSILGALGSQGAASKLFGGDEGDEADAVVASRAFGGSAGDDDGDKALMGHGLKLAGGGGGGGSVESVGARSSGIGARQRREAKPMATAAPRGLAVLRMAAPPAAPEADVADAKNAIEPAAPSEEVAVDAPRKKGKVHEALKEESLALAKDAVEDSEKRDDGGRADAFAASVDGAEGASSGACDGPTPAAPMPRRCHLAPTYFAGRAAWQRRLRLLQGLPPALVASRLAGDAGVALDPPEGSALAVDARLDRDDAEGPGRVWLRVSLRSTERWGMRRPPFDLAVIVGPGLLRADPAAVCRSLQALGAGIEPQDRLTLLPGGVVDAQWDGVAGGEVPARLAALCAHGLPKDATDLVDQHRKARDLLGAHAAAQHRVAGTRVIVTLTHMADALGALTAVAGAAVDDPTLTSVLHHGADAPDDSAWALADAGHGALEHALPDQEATAVKALWQSWSRVVARLVRVDIRLAPGVVAHRVVGSRVLDAEETREVRRREQAVDANLAKVAGVQSDRKDDGLGMTMLIPAFLGSDGHVIDIELAVPGAGPVADVVVDYKDLVRMQNARATARAELARLMPALPRAIAVGGAADGRSGVDAALRGARAALLGGDAAAIQAAAQAPGSRDPATLQGLLARALAFAGSGAEARAAVLAWLDLELASAAGCHVRPR